MEVELKAPSGKFRVIGKDHSSDSGWKKGDYSTLDEAAQAMPNHVFIRFRIYDDEGNLITP